MIVALAPLTSSAVCLLVWILPLTAALQNVTIDDTIGDPITGLIPAYAPSNKWALGQQCSTCNIHSGTTNGTIDLGQVFNGTWHDSTYSVGDPDHTVSVSFNGISVYVYNIIANDLPGTTTFTNLTFWIDNEVVGSFTHSPENTEAFFYSQAVYVNETLPNGLHSLVMHAGGASESLILFDRIVYTSQDDPSSTSSAASSSSPSQSSPTSQALSSHSAGKSSTPVGAIVGGVVGGVGVIVLLGLLVFCLRRKRDAAHRPDADRVDPFIIDERSGRPPGRPSDRRFSRTPKLPDLRFGRMRLMPRGPGSTATTTTTDASSSSRSGDGFQGHRPRLPPISPSETARIQEQAEYLSRIQGLEAQVRALEMQQQLASTSDLSGSRTQQSKTDSSERGRRSRGSSPRARRGRSPHSSTAGLRSELASLRNEIAALRGELTQDQLVVLEAAPSYVS
ncbi:hypothetical protein DICSQDRAFT_165186 [Dichomitus squalens LYAD-421 SS1]|uniref:uncharacterized protein n=1 Tax=Dichomitus squalens (strain LYAD-421) TaxID=732165 RepID=UPI0004415570|nr:uncharacterized protein DICSQDRAFT_165186 [Dichomitus squalens LYAD-421 SS1]EJF67361.1 hypothetical protein DICSQDRAFT_165186 [Dichomitus squalens LYAD-421 SS1]